VALVPESDPRFGEQFAVNVGTSYVNFGAGPGGAQATLPGGTVLKQDPNFGSGGDDQFQFTGTFPAAATLTLDYGSILTTSASGTFGTTAPEHATGATELSWTFAATAN